MKKVLCIAVMAVLGFTSCSKDETLPSPPVVEVDIRDLAVGIFETDSENGSIQYKISKSADVPDQMLMAEIENGEASTVRVRKLSNIVEGKYGLDYDVNRDGYTGIYNETQDTHVLRIIETGYAIRFFRVD